MKIAFLVYAKASVGLGHWYRSLALADAARDAGHHVWLIGNRMNRKYNYFQVRENETDDLMHVLDQLKPDWLVIDLQESVPQYIYDLSRKTRTLLLNGVGRVEEEKADITIVQGYTDKSGDGIYGGAEYVILRPGLFRFSEKRFSSNAWFVFGGAKDKMSLLKRFSESMPVEQAALATTSFFTEKIEVSSPHHIVFRADNDDSGNPFFALMASSRSACIAMGMTAWELSVLKIPIYAFSWSEGHLRFAKRMEDAGLIKVWDNIGLPSNVEIADFLKQPFVPTGKAPDELGASRVLKLMEKA